MNYTEPIPNYGDVFLVKDFILYCEDGLFTDYDGHGHPAKREKMDGDVFIYPSQVLLIPEDATHIVWFNK